MIYFSLYIHHLVLVPFKTLNCPAQQLNQLQCPLFDCAILSIIELDNHY